MNILAFDTCLDKMYVAIGADGRILASKIVETTATTYHSAFLISTITEILKENGLTPQNVDAIATNIGPGSFTGIRACTTVARVMAQGLECKTVGVSSLEILARIDGEGKGKREKGKEISQQFTAHSSQLTKQTLVALDARKEMAYAAIFEGKQQILAPQVIELVELKEMIKNEDYFIVTDDKLEPILGGISYQKSNYDLGKCLIEIAEEKLKTDYDTDWKKLLPLYIQPPALHVKKQK